MHKLFCSAKLFSFNNGANVCHRPIFLNTHKLIEFKNNLESHKVLNVDLEIT